MFQYMLHTCIHSLYVHVYVSLFLCVVILTATFAASVANDEIGLTPMYTHVCTYMYSMYGRSHTCKNLSE